MLVIKNGRLVDAKNDFYADILIDNGKIIAIGEDLTADETIDAAGKIVMLSPLSSIRMSILEILVLPKKKT